MSFGRFLGFASAASMIFAAAASAQTGAAAPAAAPATPAAAEVTAAPEAAPAPVAQLTEAHGPAQPGDAKAGATKAAACSACHGMDGNSSDPQYPKLAGQHERFIARQLALFKTGERANPIMMGFAAPLSPQDMRDIGAHFAQQKSLPGTADETLVAEGPNQGLKFYQVGERLWRGGDAERGIPACMACHGPDGRGNPGPAYPAIAGQHAGYTVQQLTAFRAGTSYGSGENANLVMAGVSKDLTDEEIQALASYVQGLHTAQGDVAAK
jgi:cytochrome c553